jgi:hypothetical protein
LLDDYDFEARIFLLEEAAHQLDELGQTTVRPYRDRYER